MPVTGSDTRHSSVAGGPRWPLGSGWNGPSWWLTELPLNSRLRCLRFRLSEGPEQALVNLRAGEVLWGAGDKVIADWETHAKGHLSRAASQDLPSSLFRDLWPKVFPFEGIYTHFLAAAPKGAALTFKSALSGNSSERYRCPLAVECSLCAFGALICKPKCFFCQCRHDLDV